jgi:hypothetical protein
MLSVPASPYVGPMRTAAVLWAGLVVLAVGGCSLGADKEFRDEHTVDGGVTAITIDGGSGSVRVTGTDGSSIHVKRHVRYTDDKPGTTDTVAGDTLTLRTSSCGVGCSVDYEVTAPKTVRVAGSSGSGSVDLRDIATASVSTSSGGLRIRGASGDVTARASSGSVDVAGVAGAVAGKTSSGGIKLRDIGGAASAEANSGSIDLSAVRGSHLSAHTSSGGITIDLATAQDVDAEASSGSIRVRTAADPHYRISTETGSGRANVKIPNDSAADHYLKLHTSSGGITVEQR